MDPTLFHCRSVAASAHHPPHPRPVIFMTPCLLCRGISFYPRCEGQWCTTGTSTRDRDLIETNFTSYLSLNLFSLLTTFEMSLLIWLGLQELLIEGTSTKHDPATTGHPLPTPSFINSSGAWLSQWEFSMVMQVLKSSASLQHCGWLPGALSDLSAVIFLNINCYIYFTYMSNEENTIRHISALDCGREV